MSHTKQRSDTPRVQMGDKVPVQVWRDRPRLYQLPCGRKGLFISAPEFMVSRRAKEPIQVRWHNGRIPELKPGEQLPEGR